MAYVDGLPVGWVSVAPRHNLDRQDRGNNFAAIDELDVWAVSCVIVGKAFRRQGLMSTLAAAAAQFAIARGAPGVEAYPLEPSPKTGTGNLYVGTPTAFAATGYTEVSQPLPRRRIMRGMAIQRRK